MIEGNRKRTNEEPFLGHGPKFRFADCFCLPRHPVSTGIERNRTTYPMATWNRIPKPTTPHPSPPNRRSGHLSGEGFLQDSNRSTTTTLLGIWSETAKNNVPKWKRLDCFLHPTSPNLASGREEGGGARPFPGCHCRFAEFSIYSIPFAPAQRFRGRVE